MEDDLDKKYVAMSPVIGIGDTRQHKKPQQLAHKSDSQSHVNQFISCERCHKSKQNMIQKAVPFITVIQRNNALK